MAWNGKNCGILTVDNRRSGYTEFGYAGLTYEESLEAWDKARRGLIDEAAADKITTAQYQEAMRKLGPKPTRADVVEKDWTNILPGLLAITGKTFADIYIGTLQYKMQREAVRGGVRYGDGVPMDITPTYVTREMIPGISNTVIYLGAGVGAIVLLLLVLRK